MSASNITYAIQRDCLTVCKSRYWYKLTYQPLMDSITVRFDLQRGETELRPKQFVYDYDSIETDCITSEEDFKVYTVVDKDTSAYTDNGINYIPTTSQESQTFAKCLIGTVIKDGKNIIEVTRDNYLNYIDNIIGCSFIDFSISNQIKDIVDNTHNSSECVQVDISYFYQVTEDDD